MARVIWTDEHRFGFHTQESISIDDFISEPGSASRQGHIPPLNRQANCRATIPKPAMSERHERSRFVARSTEFCVLVGSGVVSAAVAFSLVRAALAEPMSRLSAILSSL